LESTNTHTIEMPHTLTRLESKPSHKIGVHKPSHD
jgi:hypothetical protein